MTLSEEAPQMSEFEELIRYAQAHPQTIPAPQDPPRSPPTAPEPGGARPGRARASRRTPPKRSEPERREAARAAGRGRGTVGPEVTRGLGFTARAMVMLSPDLELTNEDVVYVATFAPEVAARMAYKATDYAFVSREEISRLTGLRGGTVMAAGHSAERTERSVGLIRLMARGVPGAVSRADGQGWRGQASQWTLTADLATWTHTPARTGEPRKITTDGPPDWPGDPRAMELWLDPRHPWWGHDAAGFSGVRLIAILLGRYGFADVTIGAADAGRLLGITRMSASPLLHKLAALGLAVRADKGRWRIRLASYLAPLTRDDLKHLPAVRPPRPSDTKSELHDWSWFDPEGRSVRAGARDIVEQVRDGRTELGGELEPWADTPRGVIIALVAFLHRALERGKRVAKALLAPAAALAAGNAAPGLPGAPGAPQRPPAAVSAPAPGPVAIYNTPEEAAARRAVIDRLMALDVSGMPVNNSRLAAPGPGPVLWEQPSG